MKMRYAAAALAMIASGQLVVADAAMAHKRKAAHRHYNGKVYYSHKCDGGNGAVGTVVGGVGGAVIGGAVVGGPVATIVGGVGGAVLGNHLDKKNTRNRKGCR